jgi:hypothetical protein
MSEKIRRKLHLISQGVLDASFTPLCSCSNIWMLNGEKAFSWRRGKMKNKEWTL